MKYPEWLTRRRKLGEGPRWKQLLLLDCIAVTGLKTKEIVTPGWAVLGLVIISPVLLVIYSPYIIQLLWCWARDDLRSRWQRRRAQRFGGLRISDRNAAARYWWPLRRKSLSEASLPLQAGNVSLSKMECRLLSLPVELRLQILTYVLKPAPALLVNYEYTRQRLLAIPIPASGFNPLELPPTSIKPGLILRNRSRTCDTSDTTLPGRTSPSVGQVECNFENALSRFQPYKPVNGILPTLQTCRQLYSEGLQVLYGANAFHFSPAPKNQPYIATGKPYPTIEGEPLARFVAFCACLPQSHLSRLRHIDLSFHCQLEFAGNGHKSGSSCLRNWRSACDYLRQMTRLRTLHIRFRPSSTFAPNGEVIGIRPRPVLKRGQRTAEAQTLRDLVGVRARDRFVVHVPSAFEYPARQVPADASFEVVVEHGKV